MSNPLPEVLVRALAEQSGLLVVGPAFTLGVSGLELGSLIEPLRERLDDDSGWEGLSTDERMELCLQSVGRTGVSRSVAAGLPGVGPLRAEVRERHRTLLGLPFPYILDLGVDSLVEATLIELGTAFRIHPLEAGPIPERYPGERLVVRLRGDLLLGEPALGTADLRRKVASHASLRALIARLAAAAPILLYGFGLRDALLPWLAEEIIHVPTPPGVFLATRDGHALWREHWTERGVEVLSGGELDAVIGRLGQAVEADRLDFAPEESEVGEALVTQLRMRTLTGLAELPSLAWLARSVVEPPNLDTLRVGARTLRLLEQRGVPIPPAAPARLADELLHRGDTRHAEQILALAFRRREAEGTDADTEGALGRALARQGGFDTAARYLERALTRGDESDVWARADDLAWLARCTLQRIERLRDRRQQGAVIEAIAAFLSGHAPRFELADLEPKKDIARRGVLYHLNLRLGRVMALAAEMAQATGKVYAEQAVRLLTRAVELSPERPNAYKAVRPLLTEPRHATANPDEWDRLVADAPEDLRRRLA